MKPTNANLEKFAAPLIARWLITASQERRVVTYGEAMEKLEREEGFTSIGRATKLGRPAGILMHRLWEFDENAPLLNALLVLQKDRMPSDGIAEFLPIGGMTSDFVKRTRGKFTGKRGSLTVIRPFKTFTTMMIGRVYMSVHLGKNICLTKLRKSATLGKTVWRKMAFPEEEAAKGITTKL